MIMRIVFKRLLMIIHQQRMTHIKLVQDVHVKFVLAMLTKRLAPVKFLVLNDQSDYIWLNIRLLRSFNVLVKCLR